jgi:hypothetical protein
LLDVARSRFARDFAAEGLHVATGAGTQFELEVVRATALTFGDFAVGIEDDFGVAIFCFAADDAEIADGFVSLHTHATATN